MVLLPLLMGEGKFVGIPSPGLIPKNELDLCSITMVGENLISAHFLGRIHCLIGVLDESR